MLTELYIETRHMWAHSVVQHNSIPCPRSNKMLLLSGAMDGSVTVLQADTGTVLWRHKAHAKYCVRVRWAGDSCHFTSCSWDHTMCVFSHTSAKDVPDFELLKSETYVSQVQDVEFIQNPEESRQLIAVALKNTNYLRLFDMLQLKV